MHTRIQHATVNADSACQTITVVVASGMVQNAWAIIQAWLVKAPVHQLTTSANVSSITWAAVSFNSIVSADATTRTEGRVAWTDRLALLTCNSKQIYVAEAPLRQQQKCS